jgi:hypothetical protein
VFSRSLEKSSRTASFPHPGNPTNPRSIPSFRAARTWPRGFARMIQSERPVQFATPNLWAGLQITQ